MTRPQASSINHVGDCGKSTIFPPLLPTPASHAEFAVERERERHLSHVLWNTLYQLCRCVSLVLDRVESQIDTFLAGFLLFSLTGEGQESALEPDEKLQVLYNNACCVTIGVSCFSLSMEGRITAVYMGSVSIVWYWRSIRFLSLSLSLVQVRVADDVVLLSKFPFTMSLWQVALLRTYWVKSSLTHVSLLVPVLVLALIALLSGFLEIMALRAERVWGG